MWRVSPSSRSSTSAAQPSSICSSGIGQWIWYRSTASRPSRARLAFELAPEPVARQVVERRAARPLGLSALGEDERPLVEAGDRSPDDLLRVAEAVLGRGVDPVHAELERAVDRRDRLLVLLRAPAPFEAAAADRPGAEADTRDLHPGRTELCRSRAVLLPSRPRLAEKALCAHAAGSPANSRRAHARRPAREPGRVLRAREPDPANRQHPADAVPRRRARGAAPGRASTRRGRRRPALRFPARPLAPADPHARRALPDHVRLEGGGRSRRAGGAGRPRVRPRRDVGPAGPLPGRHALLGFRPRAPALGARDAGRELPRRVSALRPAARSRRAGALLPRDVRRCAAVRSSGERAATFVVGVSRVLLRADRRRHDHGHARRPAPWRT